MTENKKSKQQALDRLADALVDDILDTSPEEILVEFKEDHGGAERHVAEMRALVEKSVVMANKRRLAAAKSGAESIPALSKKDATPIDINEARRLISTLMPAQKLTLAARKEGEQSDDDLLSMIEDLRELGVLPIDNDSDGKP